MRPTALEKQANDASFCDDPTHSFTLPARFYISPEVYELEKEAIFYKTWHYAGHVSQVAEPRSYFTSRIHQQNLFVTRGRDNKIRAFYNVCAHRGHLLLEGSGKKTVITCPYHAWAYDFDGKLINARNSENVDGFDKCDFSLKEIRIEIFCGMIMVNLDPEATAFSQQFEGLEAEIRRYMPAVDNLAFAQRDSYEVNSNWKLLVDNFLECYHCATAHKDFVDLVDMHTYRTITHRKYSSQCAAAPLSTSNNAYQFEPGDVDFGYAGFFVWPNMTIWLYPGESNMSVLQMNPLQPETTIEYQDWFTPAGEMSKQLAETASYQKDVLQPEDIRLCESVQQGLHSKAYNQGRFIVDRGKTELSEHAVHHFQKMVVDALETDLS